MKTAVEKEAFMKKKLEDMAKRKQMRDDLKAHAKTKSACTGSDAGQSLGSRESLRKLCMSRCTSPVNSRWLATIFDEDWTKPFDVQIPSAHRRSMLRENPSSSELPRDIRVAFLEFLPSSLLVL